MRELPAGTARYQVPELDPDVDYCFTVSVVYSTDNVETSPKICTNR